jgi:hypothetical protein
LLGLPAAQPVAPRIPGGDQIMLPAMAMPPSEPVAAPRLNPFALAGAQGNLVTAAREPGPDPQVLDPAVVAARLLAAGGLDDPSTPRLEATVEERLSRAPLDPRGYAAAAQQEEANAIQARLESPLEQARFSAIGGSAVGRIVGAAMRKWRRSRRRPRAPRSCSRRWTGAWCAPIRRRSVSC